MPVGARCVGPCIAKGSGACLATGDHGEGVQETPRRALKFNGLGPNLPSKFDEHAFHRGNPGRSRKRLMQASRGGNGDDDEIDDAAQRGRGRRRFSGGTAMKHLQTSHCVHGGEGRGRGGKAGMPIEPESWIDELAGLPAYRARD